MIKERDVTHPLTLCQPSCRYCQFPAAVLMALGKIARGCKDPVFSCTWRYNFHSRASLMTGLSRIQIINEEWECTTILISRIAKRYMMSSFTWCQNYNRQQILNWVVSFFFCFCCSRSIMKQSKAMFNLGILTWQKSQINDTEKVKATYQQS